MPDFYCYPGKQEAETGASGKILEQDVISGRSQRSVECFTQLVPTNGRGRTLHLSIVLPPTSYRKSNDTRHKKWWIDMAYKRPVWIKKLACQDESAERADRNWQNEAVVRVPLQKGSCRHPGRCICAPHENVSYHICSSIYHIMIIYNPPIDQLNCYWKRGSTMQWRRLTLLSSHFLLSHFVRIILTTFNIT